MKSIRRPGRLLAAFLFALAGHGAPAWGAAALPALDGEVIVRFRPAADTARRHALSARAEAPEVRQVLAQRAAALGLRAGHALEAGAAVGERDQVVRGSGLGAAELAALLAADPEVEFAVPNGRKRIVQAPNDPLYLQGPAVDLANQTGGPEAGQWYLRAPAGAVVSAIDVEAAWARSTGSAGVVVAVLDTGVRFEHPDLGRVAGGGRLLPGYDFVSDAVVANDGNGRDADPSDPGDWVTPAEAGVSPFTGCSATGSSWHGTATASLVGAATNDGQGMAGTAPGVQVLPLRVLGKCFGSDADIQAGMRWAAGIRVPGTDLNDTPARVINLSLGGGGACDAAWQAAVDEVVARGVTVVVAAGNSAGREVSAPGNCRGVLTVLALRHVGTKVGFSDLGPEIAIAAPGGNCVNISAGEPCLYPILAATDRGTRGPQQSAWTDSFDFSVGTSFAAPLVAGTAALMLSQRPLLSVDQLRSAMQFAARPFPTSGGDNGVDPTPVTACRAPDDSDQLQCYCNTALCGAGMLDAGAAVAGVAGIVPGIAVAPAEPVAGRPLLLDSSATLPAAGRTVSAYQWTLVDGGGIASGFTGASNAATAQLRPTAAGTLRVQLALTDDQGRVTRTERVIDVAAAPSGGGGGALSAGWLALLGAAVLALRRAAPR